MEPGGYSGQGPSRHDEQIYAAPTQPQFNPPQPYGQSPYPGQPAYGAPYPVARPTNNLALASMIVGIVGFFVPFASIVAIILGHISLSTVKRTGEEGKGYALAGTILGWVATILGLLMFIGFILFGMAASDATTGQSSTWSE